MTTLSAEQISFYKNNGYLCIKNVFSPEEMFEVRRDMDKFAKGTFTNYLDMHYHKSIKNVHRCKRMCDIADAIIGLRAIPIGCTAFFCKPNNPLENGSIWHQDNYGTLAADPNCFINIAIAVDPADSSNGSLIVAPKTHKLGELPNKPKANFSIDKNGKRYNSSSIGNECKLPEEAEIKQLEYDSGDAIILHSHILHMAKKNMHSHKWRRSLYYLYIGDKIAFWPGWTARRELLDRYDSPTCIEDQYEN